MELDNYMVWTNKHLNWLIDSGETIVLPCGKEVSVFTFEPTVTDESTMSAWAKHLRNHYCSDSEINLQKPAGMTKRQYLLEQKFPNEESPGPSIKSGDFAEILVADYLRFINDYFVPKTRYDRKTITNESSKGSDVLAFKGVLDTPQPTDELLIYEVKATLSKGKPNNRLQNAVTDSAKDVVRIAESLNAAKVRLFDKNDDANARFVGRFQNKIDYPYKESYGAAAVVTSTRYSAEELAQVDTTSHPYQKNLQLIVIHGKQFMEIANNLYERAANEA